MKNIKEVINYLENLYKNNAIYLWGANGQIITKELCDNLYKTYGSSKYNRTYYNNKFKEGKGKIGADCSGMFHQISGFDTTAQGYYDKCTKKGLISKIDKNKPCLVFKYNGSRMNHIGFYLGNNYTIEMKSSKTNCVKRKLSEGKWTHYGIPDWIDYSNYPEHPIITTKIHKLVKIISKNGVNKRTSPDSSVSTNKCGVYVCNSIVEVIEITNDKKWYKDVNGNYITANYKWVIDLTGIVYNCSQLNMRDKNNTTGKILKVLDVDTEITLLKYSNGWYYINFKGVKGWVNSKYVKVN